MIERQRKEGAAKALLFATFVSASSAVHASALGIAGGSDLSGNPYAAILPQLDGSILTVSGLPSAGVSTITTVDINASGLSLIGGRDDSAAYASFVADDASLIPLTLSISTGTVFDLAINTSGLGLLGVENISLGDYYATFVTSDGTVTPVLFSSESLNAVDLNDTGVGLVGGEGGDVLPYAAFVTSDGTISTITLSSVPTAGHTSHVAINSSGDGIVGAFTFDGGYLALVYSDLSSTPASGFPSDLSINGVAINDSGIGLVGGQTSGNGYAGLVALDGSTTALIGSPFSGTINSVALNNSGVGLIGGSDDGDFYAAIMESGGSLIPLFTSSSTGSILSVAINAEGVGLIGGETGSSEAYAALVAPNGTLTPLTLSASSIGSVALAAGSLIVDQVVPNSVGPYSSIFYSQLAIARAHNARWTQQNRVWAKSSLPSNQNTTQNEIDIARLEANLAFSPAVHAQPKQQTAPIKKNSFWFEPFGDLLYLGKQGSVPQYSNQVAGALIGYDRQGVDYIVGASVGYAFNYVHVSDGMGHAKVQEEVLSLYGSWYGDHVWIAATLSAGPYQVTNTRHFLGNLTATGKYHGWIFDPHIEIATPWPIGQTNLYYVEPFAQFDWINNWQSHYTETGATGFHLQVPAVYNSLLQSEAGLRFYEQFLYRWGKLCLEEKISYINQAPFNIHPQNVAFVGSAASFPVALASSQMQNLGSAQLLACFVPKDPGLPYGGFSFDGTAGSSFQSYFANVFLGVDF